MNTNIPFEQIGVDSSGRPRYFVFGQEIEYGPSAGYYGAKPTTETRNTKVTFPDGKEYIVDLDIAKDGHVTITYGTPNGGYYGAGYNKDTAQSMSSSDFNNNFGATPEPTPTPPSTSIINNQNNNSLNLNAEGAFNGMKLSLPDGNNNDEASIFDYYIQGTENGHVQQVEITPGTDFNTTIDLNLANNTNITVYGFVKDGKYYEVARVDWGWEYYYEYPTSQTRTFTIEYPDGWTESFTCVSGSLAEEIYFNTYLKSKGVENIKGVGANTFTTSDGIEIRVSYTTSDGEPAYQRQPASQEYSGTHDVNGDGSILLNSSNLADPTDLTPNATVEPDSEPAGIKYTSDEIEMIRRAIEGDGITTGNTFYDSLGVVIPLDFARFIRGIGDGVGVKRGNGGSDLEYYPNYDYDEDNPNVVRLEQEGITEVMDFLMEHNGIEALNAYANGASWEESGMSALNSYILAGSNLDGYSTEEINNLAERMFWNHYIRNFGDVDTGGFSQDYGYTDGIGLSNYFSLVSVEADATYDSTRLQLMQDLKGMLALQLEPVNEALGYILTAPTPTPSLDIVITDDDYDPVSSNYYTNQLATYNTNYKDAVSKLNNIITKLTALYDSFKNSNGTDISKIRNDLTLLIKDLDEANTRVKDKKKKTNGNAESCERCFQSWNTKYGKASINDEGIVYRVEIINKEGSEDEQEKKRIYASVDEMLNS